MPDGFVLVILLATVLSILGAAGRGWATREVENRTVRYCATTIEDTQRRYSADAALYAGNGWAVHNVAWDPRAQRPTLVATYARYAEEDLRLEVARWSLRTGARARRHVAAILTAIAVPVVTFFVLEDQGALTEVGTVVMLSAVVLGVVIGLRSEHLGRGPDKWLDWSVVIVGTMLGLLAVLVLTVFFALFGSLLGLHVAAAAFGAWLVLRPTVGLLRMLRAWRQRPV